jgi:hypothetical protein
MLPAECCHTSPKMVFVRWSLKLTHTEWITSGASSASPPSLRASRASPCFRHSAAASWCARRDAAASVAAAFHTSATCHTGGDASGGGWR